MESSSEEEEEKVLHISPPKARPRSVQKKSVCAVACCQPPYPPGTSFHRFPKKDKNLAAVWAQACKRQDTFKPENSRICSQHFDRNQFEQRKRSEILYGKYELRLKKTATPTLFLHPTKMLTDQGTSDREIRLRKRDLARELEEEEKKEKEPDVNNNLPIQVTPEEKLKMLEDKVQSQEKVISDLRKKIKSVQRKNCRLRHKKKVPTLSAAKKVEVARQILLEKFKWSPQQVDFFLKNKKQAQWSSDDLVMGLTLRAVSRKAYQILRRKRLLPLPSLSTLRDHVRHFKCQPGLQEDIMRGIIILCCVLPYVH